MLFDTELAIMGVLHDVIEDSGGDITLERLQRVGFSSRVINGLACLTHKKEDDYLEGYIPKICQNYDAIRVKRKDLEHNSDITRLKGITPKDCARMEKYHKAFVMLTEAKRKFQKSGE